MDSVLKQCKRIYYDNGKGDVDFSRQKEALRLATNRLNQATQDLVRASEHLNKVAMGVDSPDNKQMH